MMIDLSEIKAIKRDSRLVEKGDLFIAVSAGTPYYNFIDEAIKKGARAIVLSKEAKVSEQQGVIYWYVDSPRKVLSILAQSYFPHQPEHTVAITGTNGKTSVSYFYMQLCAAAGFKSAAIGTLGVLASKGIDFAYLQDHTENNLTTPDAMQLHYILHELAENGVTHTAIEASSHGLSQFRLDSARLEAACFTNFSQDHLDYHGDMELYLQAKTRLFKEIMLPGTKSVLNADIPQFKALEKACLERGVEVMTYGCTPSDIRFISLEYDLLTLELYGKRYQTPWSMVGEFQIYNMLGALGLALSVGVPLEPLLAVIPKLQVACGRLEKVITYRGADIYVDYAHTPDGLEVVLKNLRARCGGRVGIVFGCGGDREQMKRPIMGEIADTFADFSVVTDDNPRFEEPSQIRQEILSGFKKKEQVSEIASRREAIAYAILKLQPEDILLVAGKGHEAYQLIKAEKIPFSDHEIIKSIVAQLQEAVCL